MKRVFALMIFVLLIGCATPYQRAGFRGGYEDGHIKDNIYYVSVNTNLMTSHVTAAQYFHRRAREVCLENGYQDYRISEERNTSGVAGTYGGGSVSAGTKPGFAGYVECLKKKK